MLKTPPGKGREKIPGRKRRDAPSKSSGPPAELPEIKTDKDFDRVLRGLLGVPADVRRKRGRR